jgi:putative ABC transport system permease protein
MTLLLRRLVAGIRALARRERADQDLNEELTSYLDAAIERHLAAGLSREAATRAARAEIGSTAALTQRVREAGWESVLESISLDLRLALRGLRRSPGFTLVAILTLALGIGANAAIFSVVNGLLLRSLSVTSPDRLAVLSTRMAIDEGFPAGWNYIVWKQIHDRPEVFGRTVSWTVFSERFDLAQGGEADPVEGLFVSGNFFNELGVSMARGRTFTEREDRLGAPESQVAVISYGLWQRRFGGATDVVGRRITVERIPIDIVGIAPPEFLGPEVGRAFDIALPLGAAPIIRSEKDWGTPAGRSFLAIMVRLQPGRSMTSVTAALRAVQRRVIEATLRPNEIWGPYQEGLVRDPFTLTAAATGTSELRGHYTRPLITILVIAAVVLLIACANLANLLLARATAREHELNVRRALGAARWRLAQQMLVESLLLSVAGGIGGLLLSLWGGHALVAQLSNWFDRVTLDVSLDWRVLIFTSLVSMLTAILFGTAPAVRASSATASAALTEPLSHRGGGRASHRVHGGFVMGQVALSILLLVAAGLFIRTFQRVATVPLGFSSERILLVDVNAARAAVEPAARADLYERLTAAVSTMPGVVNVASSLNTPVNRGATFVGDFNVLGVPPVPEAERRLIVNFVTRDWFATYGIALRLGRGFLPSDTTGAPAVVIVNDAFARKFFPGRNPVGEAIAEIAYTPDWKTTPRTIVGVVSDSVDQSLRSTAYPTLYQPLSQWSSVMPQMPPPPQITLSVRAATNAPAQLAGGIADALTSVDRRLAFSFHPLADRIRGARQQERLIAVLSGFFGALALGLAAIGLYGITAYAVARRRAEIGIRMALGARRLDVVSLALRPTMVALLTGLGIGLVAAAALTRYLEALLFGIAPLDPLTFIAAPGLLAVVALVGCVLPARRATSIDPMLALRCE